MENGNKGTVKWIIGLCIATTVAVVGWTITGTLATRMSSFTQIASNVSANNIRLSVLENKYDTISTQLSEIKVLLQSHMGTK